MNRRVFQQGRIVFQMLQKCGNGLHGFGADMPQGDQNFGVSKPDQCWNFSVLTKAGTAGFAKGPKSPKPETA